MPGTELALGIVAAAGSVLSAYIARTVRTVAIASNGRLLHLENELKIVRSLLDESERKLQDKPIGR